MDLRSKVRPKTSSLYLNEQQSQQGIKGLEDDEIILQCPWYDLTSQIVHVPSQRRKRLVHKDSIQDLVSLTYMSMSQIFKVNGF